MKETEKALADALAQTGFPFEHHIFQQATHHGWSTIPNRLYIDAEEEKTREMDLLCYKAERGSSDVMAYTTLIISCKARTDKPWVMMTRPWPRQRPAWYTYPPVPTWTNTASLRHELALPPWGVEYFDEAARVGLAHWSEDSREEVFALQEFEAIRDAKARKPLRFKSLNDTSLYMGAMSLLKALAYELDALGHRRAKETERLVYQFNLIQMLDGELYEASFASGTPEVKPVDRYRYFARTMLNGKEHSARIDFCTRSALSSLLNDMDSLHRFNVTHFNGKHQNFYSALLQDQARLDALAPLLESKATQYYSIFLSEYPKPQSGWLRVEYEAASNTLKVRLDCRAPMSAVRASPYFTNWVAQEARSVYKFSGSIELDEDIPF